jgi:hypothetical protein
MLHNFWFARALEAFKKVIQADPQCAMAYWSVCGGERVRRGIKPADLDELPLLFGHLIFDDADYGHKDGSAHAAAGHVGQDALQVETAAAGRRGSHYRLEERATQGRHRQFRQWNSQRVPRLLSFSKSGNMNAISFHFGFMLS